MNFLLGPLLSFVLLYKYVALFVIVYLAAVIVPLPSNAMLLAVGAFASQGYINFWIVLVLAVGSNILGDCTDYGLTRRYGEAVIRKFKINKNQFFKYLEEEMKTDAVVTVFVTRFAGLLCPIASFLAGLVRVPFGIFLFFDFLGNFIEQSVVLSLGYLVGNYWSSFSDIFGIFVGIAAAAIVLFILARIYRRIMRRYTRR
jgi:membrane-associated protein